MVSPLDNGDAPAISRREAIRRAALLAGVVLTPEWLAFAQTARTTAATPAYLTKAEFSIASAMAERIIPRTDTPGAIDVGVPAFIDLLYGEFLVEEERQLLTRGLAGVETAARSAHGASFPTLPAERQDEVLRGIARADQGRDQSFFGLFRTAVVTGYFTSEDVGRNVLHYDPVPGRYDACVPIDEVGRRSWTT